MLQRKESKMESMIKKTKFRTTFDITLYLHHFTSISLAKQGTYFIAATICPKSVIFKSQNNTINENTLSKSQSTRSFHIKYNNHTEMLSEMNAFSFYYEEALGSSNNNSRLLLVFQLYRCKNQQTQEPQRKLADQYQCVSQFSFEIKTSQQLSFVEYFDVKFQVPYAGELSGFVSCLMTNYDMAENDQIIQMEGELMQENKIDKVKSYFALVSHLKKLAKSHRFSSYTIQKNFQQIFIGFNAVLTIPTNSPKRPARQAQLSLLTQQILSSQMSIQSYQSKLNQKMQVDQTSIEVPKDFLGKILHSNQKNCNEQDFMSYLALIQHEDKRIQSILKEIKTIGRRNKQILKQISSSLSNNKEKDCRSYTVSLQKIISDYQSNKSILYGQKTTYFGMSLASAAQQMKIYEKNLSCLKSKQKENYFTKMNQLFHLNPDPQSQLDGMRFDRCPYVFYSHQIFYKGVKDQQIEQENEFSENAHEKQRVKNKKEEIRYIFILAHGYQASYGNMERLKISLKKFFPKSKILLLKSYSQHMDRKIEQMGQKAAKQIETSVNQILQSSTKKTKLIMVGHSMGGIILRASFQHLAPKFKKMLHTYMSFATPHLGYIHCKSLLTQTGIKLIQSMHPSISLKQLSNKDNANIKETFIYKLATSGSLKQFQNIILLSSMEDKYVPWNSARLQLYKQPQGVAGKSTSGGWSMCSQKHYLRFVEQEMMNQILGVGLKEESRVTNVHRFEMDFNINHINLDSMIGRTAHVAFLANQHIIPIVFQNCLAKGLYAELNNK